MTKFTTLFLSVFFSVGAFAAKAPLLFVYSSGQLANVGIESTCKIYGNHPELKDRTPEVINLITVASQEEFKTEEFYIRAKVPSVEYYAYKYVDQKQVKVALIENYGSYQAREGKEAHDLVQLIQKLCNVK